MMKKERMEYIMTLQIISSFAVICLHSNCFWSYSNSFKWISANFVETVFYFAVPIFLMISGATLSNFSERYDLRTYFSRRITKVIIPYTVWSLVALAYRVLFKNIAISEINIGFIYLRLVKGDAIPIYWFFPILFCVYLSIPILSFFESKKKNRILSYLVWGSVIVNIAIPFIINLFHIPITWQLKMDVTAGYLIYPFAGAYFAECDFTKSRRIILYVLAISGFLMHFLGTYLLSVDAGSIVQTFKGYVNFPTILYSFGLFVFVKYYHSRKELSLRFKRIIRFLSQYSFPCYLLHWFILDLLIKTSMFDTQAYWYRFIIPFFTYAVIIGLTWLIRKVPILKHILP